MEEAENALVDAPMFAGSTTRKPLWDRLIQYLLRFKRLEELHAAYLGGRTLVDQVWLAGSFVSAKINPNDIDLSVFVNNDPAEALKGKPGVAWLSRAFQRSSMQRDFCLDPLEVRYRPVEHVFRTHDLTEDDRRYFVARGSWDDWWQRLASNSLSKTPPTLDTAVAVRGYLEVTL